MSKTIFLVLGVVILTAVIIALTNKKTLSTDNVITVEKVKELIDKKEDFFLLDVRTIEEYKEAHIKEAAHIPMNEIESRLSEIPKDKDVVVHCAVGGRSSTVTKFLIKKGYTRAYNMLGGIVKWRKMNYPVEK